MHVLSKLVCCIKITDNVHHRIINTPPLPQIIRTNSHSHHGSSLLTIAEIVLLLFFFSELSNFYKYTIYTIFATSNIKSTYFFPDSSLLF